MSLVQVATRSPSKSTVPSQDQSPSARKGGRMRSKLHDVDVSARTEEATENMETPAIVTKKKGRPRKDRSLSPQPKVSRVVNAMAHVCTQCSATFADKDQLKEHLESHADESEQAPTLGLLKKEPNRNGGSPTKGCRGRSKGRKGAIRKPASFLSLKETMAHDTLGDSKNLDSAKSSGSDTDDSNLPLPTAEDRKRQSSHSSSDGKDNDDLYRTRGKRSKVKEATQQRKNLKTPETYTPGSQEELWSVEIAETGQVSCPNCHATIRKTVEGIKKHLQECTEEGLKCEHCSKEFKSLAGIKYHLLAEHNQWLRVNPGEVPDEETDRERLRQVIKRIGKIKCPKQGCTASFLSLMGYQYHAKRCGKDTVELAAMNYKCMHCSREYHSKAGYDYHINAKHSPAANKGGMGGENDMRGSDDGNEDNGDGMRAEGNRLPRKSAMRAVRQIHELVVSELARDWPLRKIKDDLIPHSNQLRYTKPGLPNFIPKILEKWRRDVKKKGEVICPNQGCSSTYTSVSGLRGHLSGCEKGEHFTGQYQCLICQKELASESGVKYHITSKHNVNWFLEPGSSSGGDLGTKSKKKRGPGRQRKVMLDASATATRTGLPKQGRGRPKGGSLAKQGRGRPRRSVDPAGNSPTTTSPVKRGRGRPKCIPNNAESAAEEHISGGTKGEAVKSNKGRGRPTAGKFGMEGGPREDVVVEEEATLGEGVAMMDEAAMVMLGGSGDEIAVSTGFERGIGDRKVRDKNENIGMAIVQLTRVDDEEMEEEVHLEVDGITGIEWHNP
ncbi:zinc finger protein 512-like isoform X2 [Lethenteron reissneri]|nr:zinc finger protein 512-like isoform X2 [Lethenteron reissneri]XP_061405369.1 zinc finger protein 512-like isoform X2 [Lethenteron reissneri]XP_061405370.1 zinc finger protein 512-like isoform X2 [Lethenteron reissneri]